MGKVTSASRIASTTADLRTVEWAVSRGLIDYPQACAAMEDRVRRIAEGSACELVWLLEHPALYTAGTSSRRDHLRAPSRLPVFAATRGGQHTYHGPGQRVAYVMLDVRHRFTGDVRAFVRTLEAWVIHTLDRFNVRGETRPGRVGVWVRRPDKGPQSEDKIAAIGLRIQKGISLHGISLNVEPDLRHYVGIVPCGVSDAGVTSLSDLGLPVTMEDVDNALRTAFEGLFGPTAAAKDLSLVAGAAP